MGLLSVALAFASVEGAAGEEGVTTERILFGQSSALSGPAAELGIEMHRGIAAAFAEANAAGGIGGRHLELVSRDDRYEPEAAIANTQALIAEDKVFALIGEVGTPTSAAAEPIARAAGVPFIAPFTGAEFLRDPALTNVVNVRASYFEETETIVDRLVTDIGASRIAVLYQDDSYGRTGLAGVTRALERRNMTLAGAGTYFRNTTAVKTALLGAPGGQTRGDHRHRRVSAERRVHAVGAEARRRCADRQHLLRRRPTRSPRRSARRGMAST